MRDIDPEHPMTSGYIEHAFRWGRPLAYLISQRCCGWTDKWNHGFSEFDPDRMIGSEMGETNRPSFALFPLSAILASFSGSVGRARS